MYFCKPSSSPQEIENQKWALIYDMKASRCQCTTYEKFGDQNHIESKALASVLAKVRILCSVLILKRHCSMMKQSACSKRLIFKN